MRFYEKTRNFTVLGIILTVCIGCRLFQIKELAQPVEVPKKTVVTKENLKQNLAAQGIKMATVITNDRPNPLTLQLKFSNRGNKYFLNQEYFDSFGELANTLNQVFREREKNGLLIEGTNEVYKIITLPAYQKTIDEYNSKNIYVEDFEKLVDDLRGEGFDQIELDINDENLMRMEIPLITEYELKIKPPENSKTDSKKSVEGKTISGGVLNGKAIDLPKPAYPAAARAVRASGAVNVQVTVDENGNVVSANAVSGHPLLRASAAAAARNTKFNPTLLSGKPVKITGVLVFNFVP